MDPRQQYIMQNAQARGAVLNNAVSVIQKVATYTKASNPYTSGQATTINCPLQNVGLIKRVWIKVTANVQQGAAETQNLQTFGPANFFSNVQFADLQNLIRINTSGLHLHLLDAARRTLAFGAAFTSDNPCGIGNNYNVIKAPSAVTAAADLYMMYEVPFSYSDVDLRGAIFAGTVNSTMNLALTINPSLFITSTGNGVDAVYKSTTAQLGVLNSYTIDVYMEYLDQLPRDANGNYILPMIDLAQQYTLLSSVQTGLAVNSDYAISFAALRDYLSTFLVYDNGGTLNAGTDINYFTVTTANQMNLLKYDPFVAQLINGRNKINDDWPLGTYYFPFRDKPLSTLAQGNTVLNVNASTVNANARILAFFEFFASQTQLQSAPSINV